MEPSNLEKMTSDNKKQEAQQKSAEKTFGDHSNSSSKKQNSGSMNIDELLNSLWNVEGSQFSSMIPNQNALTNNDKSMNEVWADTRGNQPKEQNPNVVGNNNFSQQFYSTIPPNQNESTNGKTMEDVWAEIHGNQPKEQDPNVVGNNFPQCQQALGEITLEDFLIKVGVIHEAPLPSSPPTKMSLDPNVGGLEPTLDLKFSYPDSGNNHLLGTGNGSSHSHQVLTPNNYFVGETSGNGMQHKKRRIIRNGPVEVEVPVDRKQRRMIKNRESAARSRARKQAYLAELEIELNNLREENETLKLTLAELEKQQEQEQEEPEVEPLTKAESTKKKMKTIRRISSLSW